MTGAAFALMLVATATATASSASATATGQLSNATAKPAAISIDPR